MKDSSTRNAAKQGAADVDAYLASVPAGARKGLKQLREAIRAAAPGAEEGFSYGLPAFRLGGRPLVCYAACKHHNSFYPMSSAVMRTYAGDLKAYETSKGTIRFPPDKPLPRGLVKKLVKHRILEVREKAGTRTPRRLASA